MKRLTAHLINVKKEKIKDGIIRDEKTGKTSEKFKSVIYNTITIRDLEDQKDITDALSKIKSKHTIAIAERTKGCWKAGQEMYHIANQK